MCRHRYSRRYDFHVAQLILMELQRQGLTRSDLASRLGRTAQYATDILTGRKQMDPYLAVQLERLLSRPALDFLAAALEDERCNPLLQTWLQAIGDPSS